MDALPVSPKVSVAMCTYNGAAYIAQQLDSIATQTVLPDEIIICDDGSTDQTLTIIEAFRAHFPHPITVHRNPVNLGSIRNFEQAMRMCTGDIILLSDQDDIWYPYRVERSVAVLMSDDQIGYIFSDADLIDGEEAPLHKMLWKSVRFHDVQVNQFSNSARQANMIFSRPFVTGATLAFKAGLLNMILPIPEQVTVKFHHDRWIALILSANAYIGQAIRQPFIQYRVHATQQIGVIGKRNLSEKINRALQDFLNPLDKIAHQIAMLDLIKEHVSDAPHRFELSLAPYQIFLRQRELALNQRSRTQKLACIVQIWRQHLYAQFDRPKMSLTKDLVWAIRSPSSLPITSEM